MKKAAVLFFALGLFLLSCKTKTGSSSAEKNKDLAAFFNQYYENRLKLYPLEATYAGETAITISFQMMVL